MRWHYTSCNKYCSQFDTKALKARTTNTHWDILNPIACSHACFLIELQRQGQASLLGSQPLIKSLCVPFPAACLVADISKSFWRITHVFIICVCVVPALLQVLTACLPKGGMVLLVSFSLHSLWILRSRFWVTFDLVLKKCCQLQAKPLVISWEVLRKR